MQAVRPFHNEFSHLPDPEAGRILLPLLTQDFPNPSYYSRVRNSTLLSRAGVIPFPKKLLQNKLLLLGKVARSPEGSTLRNSTFIHDSLRPQVGRYVRRVGRPRLDWFSQVMREGAAIFGSSDLERSLTDFSEGTQQRWTQKLITAFKVENLRSP